MFKKKIYKNGFAHKFKKVIAYFIYCVNKKCFFAL